MIRRMATVRVAKAVKMKNSTRLPAKLFMLRPMWITMVHSTSDSSGDRETHNIQFSLARGAVGLASGSATPHLQWVLSPGFPQTLVGPLGTANLAKALALPSGHHSPWI